MTFDTCSLPKKIYVKIFGHLTLPQLSIVSTVCKTWSTHAFSLLYHRVNITGPTVWSHFIEYNLFQKHSSHCEELIMFSINISPSDKSLLLEHTNDLKCIALLKCHSLDQDFLYELTRKHSLTLEEFTLWGPRYFESSVTILTDTLLKPCLTNLLNVNHLSICAANISDQFLLSLVSTLSDSSNSKPPSLVELDLTECWKITAFGVAELFSPGHLPSFNRLKLQYHHENTIDVEFFEFLAASFPNHHFEFLVTKSYLKNKILTGFDQVCRDLDNLSNRNLNVTVEKCDNVWMDHEILEKFVPSSNNTDN